ncbi:MAG: inverse autotransporter beta domain-containing protein [Legionella sp.]|uniref:inverse autotransporter beta domain-containing protein n=1 Tax=Legionella sp. TaxID=459 RepID=UPI002846DFF2|nr:inverse autotransporter beta domain-containing protein [Legionella sp.]
MQYRRRKISQPVPSLVLTSILFATTVTPMNSVWAFGGPWKPRQTLNIQGGHGLQDYYDALLPISGDAGRMFYINGAFAGTHHVTGGDLGLGYRQIILNNEYVIGGYALMGRYQTNYHNMFTQLTLGTELFGTIWEGRAHLYQPTSRRNKFVSTRSEGFSFQGNKLLGIQTTTYEHAEGGADVEVGRVVPWIPKLRGFAGYYRNGIGNDRKNINGGYGRFEYRYNNHFTFTLSNAYDREQGNFFAVGVRMSIGSPEGTVPLTAEQRMTDYSVRRRDVFTYTSNYSVPFTSVENFYFVAGQSTSGNGTFETPYGTIQEAITAANSGGNTNNYVYVCNCSNTSSYTYDLGGQLNIGPNTKLIGSGGSFTYNNTTVPSLCGSARPTLVGSLYLPGNNELTNFNITGTGTTQNAGVIVSGQNITLSNLSIYSYTGPNGANGTNGIDGDYGIDGANGTSGNNGTAAYGIFINNSSNVLINNVTVNDINGGNGGVGGNGGNGGPNSGNATNGGFGADGGSGGDAWAIAINNSSLVTLNQVAISNVLGGSGNLGGSGGNGLSTDVASAGYGGGAGSGGNGGTAGGLSLDTGSSISINTLNISGAITGGNAGTGGNGGAGSAGYEPFFFSPNSGFGGNGGNGGNGGDGGSAVGISITDTSSISASGVTLSGSYSAGAAGSSGNGGAGGDGGNARTSGTAGGNGGTGGAAGNGGNGGNAYGIQSNSGTINATFEETLTATSGASAGTAGAGGTAGTGNGAPNGQPGAPGAVGQNGTDGTASNTAP